MLQFITDHMSSLHLPYHVFHVPSFGNTCSNWASRHSSDNIRMIHRKMYDMEQIQRTIFAGQDHGSIGERGWDLDREMKEEAILHWFIKLKPCKDLRSDIVRYREVDNRREVDLVLEGQKVSRRREQVGVIEQLSNSTNLICSRRD